VVKGGDAEASGAISANAGDYLYREGETSADLYFIEKGRVELLKGHGSDEGQLGVLEPGDFFGEASLLSAGTREASARALSDAQLVKVDGATLKDLLRDPDIALKMLRRMALQLAVSRERRLMAENAPTRPKARPPTGNVTAVPRTVKMQLVHGSGVQIPLPDKDELLVGRSDPKTGLTPDIDLTALDTQRSLSRRHAKILRKGGEFFVTEEPGVRNGTLVNGKPVKSGMSAVVKEGDEVSFGLVKVVLRLA
jgi:CRP-like cAMP-binding protein